jgi:streptogramin lyase
MRKNTPKPCLFLKDILKRGIGSEQGNRLCFLAAIAHDPLIPINVFGVQADGLKFVVFTRSTNPEMVNDECHALAQDDGGAIWVGTSAGLLRYEHQAFTRFTTKDGLCPGYINALCPSRSGGLWISTNFGLNRYQNGQLTQVAFAVAAEQDNGITCLNEDGQGVLWIGSARGLERFNPVTGQLSRLDLPESVLRLSVAAVSQDDLGRLWIIGDRSLYRLQNQQWELVSPTDNNHRHSRFIYHDPNGAVWTAGAPDGLNCWEGGKLNGNATDSWLKGATVFSMISDREGNI